MKPLKSQHRIAAYLFSGWLLLSFVKVAALLPKDRAGWAFALVGLALAIQVGTLAMLSVPGQF